MAKLGDEKLEKICALLLEGTARYMHECFEEEGVDDPEDAAMCAAAAMGGIATVVLTLGIFLYMKQNENTPPSRDMIFDWKCRLFEKASDGMTDVEIEPVEKTDGSPSIHDADRSKPQ